MASVISNGFREDCSEFLGDFAKLGIPDYKTFCKEWKRSNMQYIFYGRNSDVEMAEFISEVFYTVKKFFFNCKDPLERIGAFYLLYTLYFKQPLFMFCKIRLTLLEWKIMKNFAKIPYNDQQLHQVTVIFWKLFKSDAFRFVQDELEQGFDRFFHKYASNSFDTVGSFRTNKDLEKELQSLTSSSGLMNATEILEMGYNEMKEALDDGEWSSNDSIGGDKLPQSNLMGNLRNDINSLLEMLGSIEHPTISQANPQGTIVGEADSMGAKRYSLRRKAYTQAVKKKVYRITGRDSPQSDEVDDDVPAEKSVVGAPGAKESKRRGFRNIRRKTSNLSDNDAEDD
ncbi:snRNA-activating protein complex subunit 1 [Anopheles nili]|uniref:snRNA-activating protein complex subunit 1 n=1 Tax=Anopheles nili TaxID=185578 RepID=UPI00237B0065|nr:snRNA-activating protein complex subunit 1 [Anopheles nili]